MMAVRRLFTQLGLSANFLIFLSLLATPAMAQVEGGRGLDASGLQKQVDAAHETAETAALAGHNAWMLTCCALVLFMTAPGLALFYGGLVRKKNVLGVMMQCFFLMGLMTVLWGVYGYSLAFSGADPWSTEPESFVDKDGNGQWSEGEPLTDDNKNGKWDAGVPNPAFNPYIGNLDNLFMQGVARTWDEAAHAPHTPMNGAIPALTFMLFQGMFFIITPALICGAYAERMKFSTMVVFTILWGTLVYCPLAHWVWGGGILAFGGPYSVSGGALDFAGGTVVHISSGISALVCAMVLGRRLGWGTEDMRPHNLTYTVIGAAMLWVGWFGFNAGSELASDDLTSSAFATTHFAAAAGAIAWAFMEWLARGKPSVLGTASGAIAGLVCITPGAGFVNVMPALIMGAAAGIVCYFACGAFKAAFKYDDSLDAFGIHGVGGTIGAILTGVFATRAAWDITGNGTLLGLLEGGSVLWGQIVAVGITIGYCAVATFILLKILDAVMGLRVSQEGEVRGLDMNEHGEEGYIFV